MRALSQGVIANCSPEMSPRSGGPARVRWDIPVLAYIAPGIGTVAGAAIAAIGRHLPPGTLSATGSSLARIVAQGFADEDRQEASNFWASWHLQKGV